MADERDNPESSVGESSEHLADRVDDALAALWDGESGRLDALVESKESRQTPGVSEVVGGMMRRVDEVTKDTAVPKRIGDYAVKRILGRGGMGTVYLAVQEHPRRTVALKVMKGGVTSDSAMRRFEYESQILARLRHPNIAQVYEAGTHREDEEDVPYFALEYIPNARPITEYVKIKGLSTRDRLTLFTKVCSAVHHGHQKGIIHRDLKPGNILVDSNGEPRIIDFGVARATDSDMVITTLQTDIGQLIGTLQYMSPEQCEADPHDLDVRSDIYALGVVLYELMCDQLPYDVTKAAVYEAARVIRERTPDRPSSVNRALREDAETIVLKALEKDRRRRYRSAAELGDDLARYLRHEPIIARRPTAAHHFWKFIERNRVPVTVTAVILLLLIVAIAAVSGMVRQVRRSAELARLLETDSGAEGDLGGSVEDRLLLMRMADEVISVDFDHTPFDAAIAIVRDSANLPIQVDWPALAGIGVQPTDTVTLRLSGASAVTVLELMLARAGDVIDPPSYVVRDGQILITSDQAIRRLTVTVT